MQDGLDGVGVVCVGEVEARLAGKVARVFLVVVVRSEKEQESAQGDQREHEPGRLPTTPEREPETSHRNE